MATLYELTIIGRYQEQAIINRATFSTDIDDPSVASAFNLLQAAGYNTADVTTPQADSFFDAFLAAQTGTYVIEELQARNLYSVIDFATVPVSGSTWGGQIASGTAADKPFVAQKITTNRVRTDIKAGTMALTPPLETSTNAAGTLDGTALGLLQDLCDRLNAPISFTAGPLTVNFRPAVIQKEKYVPDPLKPEKVAYRYYADEEEQLEHVAVNVTWSPVPRVTSQTSRKLGKGI